MTDPSGSEYTVLAAPAPVDPAPWCREEVSEEEAPPRGVGEGDTKQQASFACLTASNSAEVSRLYPARLNNNC